MSGEIPTISSQDDIWEMIPAEAKEDWGVHQAVSDVKIQAVFRLFAEYNLSEGTVKLVKNGLEEMLEEQYDVRPERSHEVFGRVETLIWQEMEADG